MLKLKLESIYKDLLSNPDRELPIVLLGLNELLTFENNNSLTATEIQDRLKQTLDALDNRSPTFEEAKKCAENILNFGES